MIIAGRDIGGEGPQGVERRLAAMGELLIHVLLDLVHRHVARALDHDLAVASPGNPGELAQGFQLGELCGVVGIGNRTGAQSIPQREAHVSSAADVAVSSGLRKALLVMRPGHIAMMEPPRGRCR